MNLNCECIINFDLNILWLPLWPKHVFLCIDKICFFQRIFTLKYMYYIHVFKIHEICLYICILSFIFQVGYPVTLNILDPNGLKSLTRSRLGLSDLNKRKLNQNFKEYINSICSCSLQVESVSHFVLHCHYFTDIRKTIFNELQSVGENI